MILEFSVVVWNLFDGMLSVFRLDSGLERLGEGDCRGERRIYWYFSFFLFEFVLAEEKQKE